MLLVFLANVVVFFLTQALGDPAMLMLAPSTPEPIVQQFRKAHGFDQPLDVQFARYISGAIRGQFGNSSWQGVPALPVVLKRVPAEVLLVLVVFFATVLLGIPLGVLAGAKPNSLSDRALSTFGFLCVSVADFWVGIMLIMLFAVQLHWFRTSGFGLTPQYLVLPAVTLGLRPLGRTIGLVRSNVVDELGKQYVTTAHSKGLFRNRVLFRHVLRNVLITVITLIGYDLARYFAGTSVVVESIFAWPGVGLLAIQALQNHDLPLIQATVFVVAIIVGVINLLLDFAYILVNPQIRLA